MLVYQRVLEMVRLWVNTPLSCPSRQNSCGMLVSSRMFIAHIDKPIHIWQTARNHQQL